MPALLRPRRLILNMDARSSLLNEQLGQFHDSSQTSVSGISVCDDGAQVIDVCELGTVGFGSSCYSFFALLAVVEELGLEEVLDFVWDGGLEVQRLVRGGFGGEEGGRTYVGVISQIWTRLIRGRGSRRRLPAGNVDSVEVFRHLGQHCWF